MKVKKKLINPTLRPRLELGQVITLPRPAIIVKKASDYHLCEGCYFYDGNGCSRTEQEAEETGSCSAQSRPDKQHVIFRRMPGLHL